MAIVHLERQRVIEVAFSNSVNEDRQMVLSTESSFKVSVNDDHKTFFAELKHKMQDVDEPSAFAISVTIQGVFESDVPLTTKELRTQAHNEAYDILFPYIQPHYTYLTATADLPILLANKGRFDKDEVLEEVEG